jgi:hypothetical protein
MGKEERVEGNGTEGPKEDAAKRWHKHIRKKIVTSRKLCRNYSETLEQ